MIFPNLVIAGAPKCGTTSFYDYLKLHPSVCPSVVKETRYLIDKNYILCPRENNYHKYGLHGYGNFFSEYDPSKHKIIFEATPDYLYQKTAIDVLSRLSPPAKLMFILRKPSERIYSLYNFAKNNMAVLSNKITFRDFIKMVVDDDNYLKDKPLLRGSIEQSIYIRYLDRWLEKFQKTDIKIIIFEDFIKGPGLELKAICEEFGMEPSFYDGFSYNRKNKSKSIRYHWLQGVRKRISFSFFPAIFKKKMLVFYEKINIDEKGHHGSDNEVYADVFKLLAEYFDPFNRQLGEKFNINLSSWKEE